MSNHEADQPTVEADLLCWRSRADDVAALLKHLGLVHADILGYSLAGGVALQTVIRHPELARKLVVVSAPCKSDGWYAEVLTGMCSINAEIAKTWIGSPMLASAVTPFLDAPMPEAK